MFEWEAVYFQLLVNLEQGLLKSLFSLLRQHQDNFIKTLDERPPKKELRDKIQKKESVKSGEAYKRIAGKIDEIIKLSDALKLNEHDVVELLVKVESKNAKILYYGNRSFMLYSLLTILNVAFDVTRSAEIRAPLGNFVQELFVSGLIEKLIRTIEVNVTKPKDAYIIKEQTALSNILFTLFYVSPSSLKSVRAMVNLLQSTSLAFEKQRKTLSNAELKQSHDYFLLARHD